MKKHRVLPALAAALLFIQMPGVWAALDYTRVKPHKAEVINTYPNLEERMSSALVLKVDNDIAYVNNERVSICQSGGSAPKEIGGEVFVPLDFIVDAVGGIVERDDRTGNIKVMHSTYMIDFIPGEKSMTVKNLVTEQVALENPVQEAGGVMMVPLAPFVEALDLCLYRDENGILFVSEPGDALDSQRDAGQIAELAALYSREPAEPEILYAIPGDGGGRGTAADPFRGFEAAKEGVREMIAAGLDRDVEVLLAGGSYEVSQTVTFTTADSGQNHHTVTYKSRSGETAEISGGRKVTVWKPYKDNIYVGRVSPKWNTQYLYENGQRGITARTPNVGWNKWEPDKPATGNAVYYNEGDYGEFADTKHLQISYWHSGWFTDVADVAAIDFDARRISIARTLSGNPAESNRYFLQNSMDFLDQPGEFYNDFNGSIYYIPRNGKPSENDIEVTAINGDLLKFQGDGENNPVKNIRFEGVTIKNTTSGGNGIKMDYARNIRFDGCTIKNTGFNAVSLSGWCKNNAFVNSHIYNAGRCGVELYGNYQGYIRTTMRNNRVENCHIHDVGQIYGEASGVHVFSGGYNRIMHNLVYNSNRYDISLAGFDIYDWSYRETVEGYAPNYENRQVFGHTTDNIIAFNDCSRANLDSDDTGPINLWNVDTGNIVYGNDVHDSTVPFNFCFGIYLDDRCENTLVRKNIVRNIYAEKDKSMVYSPLMVKGENNSVENNLIVDNPDTLQGAYQLFNVEDDFPNKTSLNNIFYNNGDILYYHKVWRDHTLVESDGNVYYNDSGKYLLGGDAPMTEYADWYNYFGGKLDSFSKIADPRFMDAGDYRLRYDSPALGTGVSDLDFAGIGLKAEYPFADQNEKVEKVFAREAGAQNQRSYLDLSVGGRRSIETAVRSETGFLLKNVNIQYQVADPAVARVDADGTVTGIAPGVTALTVTAAKNGSRKSCTLNVLVGDSPERLEIRGLPQLLCTGQEYPVQLVSVSKFGKESIVEDALVTADGGVAYAEGKVRAETVGAGKLYAVYTAGGKTVQTEAAIDIVDGMLDEVIISTPVQWIYEGDTVVVKTTAKKDNGLPISAGEMAIAYTSDSLIVGEARDGAVNVTAEKPGAAKLRAEVNYHGTVKLVELELYVRPKQENLDGWQKADVGSQNSTVFRQDGKFHLITDSGDIFGKQDNFVFLYKEFDLSQVGDGMCVSCTIDPYAYQATDSHAVGVMIRAGLAQNAAHANMRIQPDGTVRGIYRAQDGGESGYFVGNNVGLPYKVELVKNGSTCTFLYGTEEKMTEIGSAEITFGGKVYVGIAAMANAKGKVGEAVVENISIEPGN